MCWQAASPRIRVAVVDAVTAWGSSEGDGAESLAAVGEMQGLGGLWLKTARW